MDIFGGIASVLSGGLTGILGSVAQGILEYKTKQLEVQLQKDKLANDVAMKQADAAILAQEWAARTKIADTEAVAQVDTEDSKAFAVSLTSEPKVYHEGTLTTGQNWLMVGLDFLRGIIRPFLTIYLCALTTAIYIQARRLLHIEDFPINQAYDLVTQIINTILYVTTTVIFWWFGSRTTASRKVR